MLIERKKINFPITEVQQISYVRTIAKFETLEELNRYVEDNPIVPSDGFFLDIREN